MSENSYERDTSRHDPSSCLDPNMQPVNATSNPHIQNKNSRNCRCRRTAKTISDISFDPITNTSGSSHQLSLDDVLSIINRISKDPRCPAAPIKNWGSIIAAVFSMFSLLAVLGIRGSERQKQCKQAITCSLVDHGDDDALVMGNMTTNNVFLCELLPHMSRRAEDWVKECRVLRYEYETGQSNNTCKLYDNLHRNSLANTYTLIPILCPSTGHILYVIHVA